MLYKKTYIAALAAFALLPLQATAAPLSSVKAPTTSVSLSHHITAKAVSDADLEQAHNFVEALTAEALSFLSSTDLSETEKQNQFRKLLKNRFNMPAIARFAMGKNWRVASKQEQDEYTQLFTDMIVDVYSRRFSDYKGQKIEVRSQRAEGRRDILVSSFIKNENNPDIQVDWRVRQYKNKFKVIDISVEGVSMALTQRSEFASIIQRGGGKVAVLIDHLKN